MTTATTGGTATISTYAVVNGAYAEIYVNGCLTQRFPIVTTAYF